MMNSYNVKRYALICSVNTEVEAMKTTNDERLRNGMSIAYNESHFWGKAEELKNLAAAHDDQL